MSESLQKLEQYKCFERFANYSIVSHEHSESFDIEAVSVGNGQDGGLDGIALIVNGILIADLDELEDLSTASTYLDALFIFVQSKMSSSFSGTDISNLFYGVRDFFRDPPSLNFSTRIRQLIELQKKLYELSPRFTKGPPRCHIYYVTTGAWKDDPELVSRCNAERSGLLEQNIFRDVQFFAVDASRLQRMYTATKNAVSFEFEFERRIPLPPIAGVSEAYLGVIPASIYLKLITDESTGTLRKSLFDANVRDFQSYNAVNKEIEQTLQDIGSQDRFPVLNNGVTIVARQIRTTGTKVYMEDYQVVNGCQTSHVIYDQRNELGAHVFVPIKVIATTDDEVARTITKGTNRQTQVTEVQLLALTDFQKKLEQFFDSFQGRQKLYYERRSRQHSTNSSAEKVRIITPTQQIRAFTAMFLDQPQQARRSYAALLQSLQKKIFTAEHHPDPYYTSAYTHYKLEFFFRNGQLDREWKVARYQIMTVARYLACDKSMPDFKSRKMQQFCKPILAILWDDEKAEHLFLQSYHVVNRATGGNWDRDMIQTAGFTARLLALAKASVFA
jgi:hypothetical protein